MQEAGLLIYVNLDTRGSGISRTRIDRATSHEVACKRNAEDGSATVINNLWPKDVVGPIDGIRKAFQAYAHHPPITLPHSCMRMLPPENYFKFMETYRNTNAAVAAKAQEICPDEGAFNGIIDRCRKHAGDAFDRSLYPPNADTFRSAFKVDVTVLPMMDNDATLEAYRKIIGSEAEELMKLGADKVESANRAGLDEIKGAITASLKRMVDVLSADKEKKIFDSMVASVQDLCGSLPIMNKYIKDPSLDEFYQQMSSELSHISAERLRSSDVTQRKEVADKARELLRKLEQYSQ